MGVCKCRLFTPQIVIFMPSANPTKAVGQDNVRMPTRSSVHKSRRTFDVMRIELSFILETCGIL
jgi:hypothetical protein